MSENPTSILRSWGRRSWRPKQLRIRLRCVMRCHSSDGNIPGRSFLAWKSDVISFDYTKKNSEVLLSTKDSKSREWPCCICSAKTCNALECWKSRLTWCGTFSYTFWRSSQDDANMCKHFLWIDGFFLCYILRKNKLLTFGVASSEVQKIPRPSCLGHIMSTSHCPIESIEQVIQRNYEDWVELERGSVSPCSYQWEARKQIRGRFNDQWTEHLEGLDRNQAAKKHLNQVCIGWIEILTEDYTVSSNFTTLYNERMVPWSTLPQSWQKHTKPYKNRAS